MDDIGGLLPLSAPSDRARRARRGAPAIPSAFGLVLPFGLFLGLAASGCRNRIAVSTAPAVRRDLVIPILADGTLEPEAGGEIRTPEAATVASLPVADGSRVAAGEVVLGLSNPDLSQRARDARSAASGAAADLESARAESAAAERDAERRKSTLDADDRLLRAGAITRESRDADAAAMAEADARLRAARAKEHSLGEGSGSRADLARESAEELGRDAGSLVVRAPSAGIVYGLPRRVGARVEAGEIVASIANPAARAVRIRVDEPDLPRVSVGERLTATFDGLPGRTWEGRVVAVAAALRDEGGRRVGDVTGEIADPEARIPGNASVNVSIVTGEKRGALVVPRAALLRDGARRFLFVLDGGRARRREVVVGLLGPTDAEVVSGIREGERVILPSAVPLSDGAPVSATE